MTDDERTVEFLRSVSSVLGDLHDLRRALEPLRQSGSLELAAIWSDVKPRFDSLIESLGRTAPLLPDAPIEAESIVEWLTRIGSDVRTTRTAIERHGGDGAAAMFNADAFSNLLLPYVAEVDASRLLRTLLRRAVDPLAAFGQSEARATDDYTVAKLQSELGEAAHLEKRRFDLGWDGVLRALDPSTREGYKQHRIVSLGQEKVRLLNQIQQRPGVKRLRILHQAEGTAQDFDAWLRQRIALLCIALGDDDGARVVAMTPTEFATAITRQNPSSPEPSNDNKPDQELPTLLEFVDQLDAAFVDTAKRQWMREQVSEWLKLKVTKNDDGNFPSSCAPLPPRPCDDWSIPAQLTALAAVHDEYFRGPAFLPPLLDPQELDDPTEVQIAHFDGMHRIAFQQAIEQNNPVNWIVELRSMLRNVEAAWERARRGVPDLSHFKYDILQAMLELGAVTAKDRKTAEEVAVRVAGPEANVNSYKGPLSELKRDGFLESREGRGGGIWLNNKGREVAEQL